MHASRFLRACYLNSVPLQVIRILIGCNCKLARWLDGIRADLVLIRMLGIREGWTRLRLIKAYRLNVTSDYGE